MSRLSDTTLSWRLLGRAFERNPFEMAATAAMLVGVWLCELSLPFILGRTVDAAVSRTAGGPILRLGALALCVVAILYVLHRAYLRNEVRLVARGAFRLRQYLYTRIMEQSLGFVSDLRKTDVVQRVMNDTEALDSDVIYLLADVPFSLLTVTGAFLVMLWMQPVLAVLVFIVLALVAVLANRVARPLGVLQRSVLHRWGHLGGRLQESLDAFRVVKAFGRETHMRGRLDSASERLMRAEIRAGYVDARLEPLVQLMGTLGFLAVVWYGAALVVLGSLTAGALVAFIAYMELMREPIRDAGPYYAHYRQSAASLARISEFLNGLAPRTIDGSAMLNGPFAIELQNVRLTEPRTARTQLDDVSFVARRGEIVGVTGDNGAGKSTLMDVLLGLVAPDSGWVLADGVPLEDMDPSAWRSATAAVPQETFLFDATIAENIRYGRPGASDNEISAAVEEAGLRNVIARLPLGLRTVVGDRGCRLSGGERQRVALARALIRKPRLLVLDEACSALDETAFAHIHRALHTRKAERITFVVTHDWETLTDADRVIVIEAGRVRSICPKTEARNVDPAGAFENSAA